MLKKNLLVISILLIFSFNTKNFASNHCTFYNKNFIRSLELTSGWKKFFGSGLIIPRSVLKDFSEKKNSQLELSHLSNYYISALSGVMSIERCNQEEFFEEFKKNPEAIQRIERGIDQCGDHGLLDFIKLNDKYGYMNTICYSRYRYENKLKDIPAEELDYIRFEDLQQPLESSVVSNYYNGFWDKLQNNPRKSMGGIAALVGASILYKNRLKIKKYLTRKISNLKNKCNHLKESYQDLKEVELDDIKELAKIELEERLDDFKSGYLNKKTLINSVGIGSVAGAAIFAQKKYNVFQKITGYGKLVFSSVDKNTTDSFQKICCLAKKYPKAVLSIAGLAGTWNLVNFFKSNNFKKNMQNFYNSLTANQIEVLNDINFIDLIPQSFDNPAILKQNKRFIRILTKKQANNLRRIIRNHKKYRKSLFA